MAEEKKTLIRCMSVKVSVEIPCDRRTYVCSAYPSERKMLSQHFTMPHYDCVQTTPYENKKLLLLNSHMCHIKNVGENIITTFA